MLHKLRKSSGETLAETLVSVMVVVISLTMLAGAIVSSSKVNAKAMQQDTGFKEANVVELQVTNPNVVISGLTPEGETETIADETVSVSVTFYGTDDNNDTNHYRYYR